MLAFVFAAKKTQSRDEKNSWKASLLLCYSWLRITEKNCYLIKAAVSSFWLRFITALVREYYGPVNTSTEKFENTA